MGHSGKMNTELAPAAIAAPAAHYAHGMLVPAGARLVFTAGVVPIGPDGQVPEDLGAQAATVWANIAAILADAGMAATDIVSVTTYVVVGHDLATVMAARDTVLGAHKAASTLVYLPALARPEWKLEIAVVAARAD
jgi:enamine deaminase RidA (YjgF/YER057c/UK114 family)